MLCCKSYNKKDRKKLIENNFQDVLKKVRVRKIEIIYPNDVKNITIVSKMINLSVNESLNGKIFEIIPKEIAEHVDEINFSNKWEYT